MASLQFWIASTRKFILEGRQLSHQIREELFGYVKKQMASVPLIFVDFHNIHQHYRLRARMFLLSLLLS